MPKITFVNRDGSRAEVEAPVGETLLDVAQSHAIDIEGACEGCMACSTCHVIVDTADYDRLPAPSEDEADMLDLAYGLTPTSRLGCQVVVTEALDGLTVSLPRDAHDLRGD